MTFKQYPFIKDFIRTRATILGSLVFFAKGFFSPPSNGGRRPMAWAYPTDGNSQRIGVMQQLSKIFILLCCVFFISTIAIAHPTIAVETIDNNCLLRAEIIIEKIPTCGFSDGRVTLNVTGATGNINYSWGPSASRDDLASGFYCIIVSDEAGCTLLVDFTLGDCPDCDKFEADIFIDQLPTCSQADGGAAISILAANGMPTFSWGDNIQRDDLEAGTYSVTVTDQEGCEKVVDFELKDNCLDCDLQAKAVVKNEPSCNRNDGAICIEVSNAVGNVRHNMGAYNCYDNLAPGNYRILVSDSLCSVWCNFTLAEPIIELTATVDILKETTCARNDGAACINVTGATGAIRYDWGAGNCRDNLRPGNYSVIVSDEVCSVRVDFTLQEPESGPCCTMELSSTITQASCARNDGMVCWDITNATGEVTYSWEGDQCKNDFSPGTYTVEISDEVCSISQTFVIEEPDYTTCCNLTAAVRVNQQPTCAVSDGDVCITTTGARGLVMYDWGPYTCKENLVPGNYRVVVSDDYCSVIVEFTLDPPDYTTCCTLTASAIIKQHPQCDNLDGAVCLETTGARGTVKYSWGPEMCYDNLPSGYYSVLVSDDFCSINVPFTLEKEGAACPCSLKTNLVIPVVASCENPFATACVDAFNTVGKVTYLWDNVEGASCKSDLSPGNHTLIVADSLCTDTISFTIDTLICCPWTAEISLVQPTCVEPTGSACVVVTGAVGPVNFSWGPDNCMDNLSPGTITVVVSDDNCSDTLELEILEIQDLKIEAIVGTVTCDAPLGSVEIKTSNGIGPYTYHWSDGLVTDQAIRNDLLPDLYSVFATDLATQCVSETIIVAIAAIDCCELDGSFEVVKEPECGRTNGEVEITITGHAGPFIYTWDGVIFSDPIRTGLAAGKYEVIVVDANGVCLPDTLQINLTEQNCCFTASFETTPPDCDTLNGRIEIIVMNASDVLTFIWEDTVLMDPIRNNLDTGLYEVIIVEANTDCRDTLSITLGGKSSFTITEEVSGVCDSISFINIMAEGGNENYVFNWEDLPNEDTISSRQNLPVGSYTVQIKDKLTACTIDKRFDILPSNIPTIDVGEEQIVCVGDTATLEVSPTDTSQMLSYDWTINSGTFVTDATIDTPSLIGPMEGGILSAIVTATNADNCIVVDTAIINYSTVDFSLIADPVCGPGTTFVEVVLENSADQLSYNWAHISGDDQMARVNVTVQESTPFWVSVKNQFNCEAKDSIMVAVNETDFEQYFTIEASPQNIAASEETNLTILSNTTPDVSSNYTFNWRDSTNNQAIASNELSIRDQPEVTTTYEVVIVDKATTCTDTIRTLVNVGCQPDNIFFPNAFSPNGDNYNDVLYVRGTEGFESMELIIFNRWGQELFKSTDPAIGWDGTFEGEPVRSDVYGYYLTVRCPLRMEVLKGNVTLLN